MLLSLSLALAISLFGENPLICAVPIPSNYTRKYTARPEIRLQLISNNRRRGLPFNRRADGEEAATDQRRFRTFPMPVTYIPQVVSLPTDSPVDLVERLTTPPNFIDILKDKEVYKEVQRSGYVHIYTLLIYLITDTPI